VTPEVQSKFKKLLEPHVGGFDYFLGAGLRAAFKALPRYSAAIKPRDSLCVPGARYPTVEFWYSNPRIAKPVSRRTSPDGKGLEQKPLLPVHARELGVSYQGAFEADFNYRVLGADGEPEGDYVTLRRNLGDVPIMVGSELCHTRGRSPAALAAAGEESNEFGGCFVIAGIERCIRLLQVPRADHVLAIHRPTYAKRGASYSAYGVSVRAKHFGGDTSSVTNTLHYLTTGGCTLRFSLRKQEFLVPVVVLLKALRRTTDSEIHSRVVAGDTENTFLTDRADLLLHDSRQFALHEQAECLAYLGARFRQIAGRGDHETDVEVGRFILDRFVLIHLEGYGDK
jgi:DNA-directed RNA polymerase I subunit RPA2